MYVNGISVVGENCVVSSRIKSVSSSFEISLNKELHHLLSLKITRCIEAREIYLFKQHHIHKIARRFLTNGYTSGNTPMLTTCKDRVPRPPGGPPSSDLFSIIIGVLLWVDQCTRAGILLPSRAASSELVGHHVSSQDFSRRIDMTGTLQQDMPTALVMVQTSGDF